MKFKNIFLVLIATIATSGLAISLPSPITNAYSALQQRTLFASVFTQALWNHMTGNNNGHTLIEQKLAEIYEKHAKTMHSAQYAADDLYAAIKNSPAMTIQPHDFLIGASSSAYQIEGCLDETSACARFFSKDTVNLPIAGDAIDFYNRYQSDIKQMKDELHINSFRLSIAWNRIQPEKGVFLDHEIEFYRNILNECIKNGIKPLFVFHHYDIPAWFEDCGGFEKTENGIYFQQFVLYVYEQLAQQLGESIISMCNAPEGPAFKGYFTGDCTPGEKENLHKTHTVIANMYYELVDSALNIKKRYKQLKKSNPKLKKPYIGTQLNIVPTDPYHASQETIGSRIKTALGCAMGSYVQCGGTFNFLIHGEYRLYTPDLALLKQAKKANVYRYHPHAHKAFDWIGVNVYSNNFIHGFARVNGKNLVELDENRYTDNLNYRNYPEGIYRAVKMVTENLTIPLGKLKNKNGRPLPIIITENGIATKDDTKRTKYYQKAWRTITQLITDGYVVEGYLPWTSHDNYEWPTAESPQGFGSKCYGFFAVNFDKNSPNYLQRTLKPGSFYYADFAQAFFRV